MPMHFDESEKPGRKAALEKLMSIMGSETGKKLKGLKKPALAVEIDAEPEDEAAEMEASDEPSEDEKAKIVELYERYCK